VTINLYTLILY